MADLYCSLCHWHCDWVPVIRLTWEGSYGPNGESPHIAVVHKQKTNDTFVCLKCIRDIKRLAFSEIEGQQFSPTDPVYCHCCNVPLGTCKCVHNPDGSVDMPF